SGAAFTRPRLRLVDRRLRLEPDRDTNGAAPLPLLRKLDLSGVLVVRERDLGVVRVLFGPGDLVAAVAEPVLVLPVEIVERVARVTGYDLRRAGLLRRRPGDVADVGEARGELGVGDR